MSMSKVQIDEFLDGLERGTKAGACTVRYALARAWVAATVHAVSVTYQAQQRELGLPGLAKAEPPPTLPETQRPGQPVPSLR